MDVNTATPAVSGNSQKSDKEIRENPHAATDKGPKDRGIYTSKSRLASINM